MKTQGWHRCSVCGRFCSAPNPKLNNGEPRCDEHDYSYPGGMNYAEWADMHKHVRGF